MIEQIFRQRIDSVRHRVLAEMELDLLLAYSDEPQKAGPVRYLTDFDVYAMYALVVVPRQGDVALAFGLHHSAYLVRVKEAANADYFLGTYQPGNLCRTLLRDSGCTTPKPRIGVAGGADMFRKIENDLRAALPDALFLDADAALRACVETESPQSRNDSVARLKRSAAITRDGIRIAADGWRSGHSASEIAADVGLAARRRGSDIINRELVQVAFASGAPLPGYLDRDASHVMLRPDALTVQVRALYGGMNTSAMRTIAKDQNDPELTRCRAEHRDLCALLTAGSSADSVVDAARKRGVTLTNNEPADLGGGIGFSLDETPRLRAGGGVLPDMKAIVLQTRVNSARLGALRFADTVLVTQSGGQILTDVEGLAP
jgi:Xaa-Pro aminopeptidase